MIMLHKDYEGVLISFLLLDLCKPYITIKRQKNMLLHCIINKKGWYANVGIPFY